MKKVPHLNIPLAVFFLLLPISFWGCSTVGPLVGEVKPVDTKVDPTQIPDLHLQSAEWIKLTNQPDSADAEWQSSRTNAIIYINSACRENAEESADLKIITQNTLSQWDNLKVNSENAITVSGHPGLETTGEGTFQKTKGKFQLVIIRSPHCIYDLGLVSHQSLQNDLLTFQKFRTSLILK